MQGAASSLKPDLNLVAIRIGDVRVGEAWSKLAATEQPPTSALDFRNGAADVGPESIEAAAEAAGTTATIPRSHQLQLPFVPA